MNCRNDNFYTSSLRHPNKNPFQIFFGMIYNFFGKQGREKNVAYTQARY